MNIESLARPEIVAMKPYSSARKEAPGKGILLNANEAPISLLPQGSFNRYPDPQPDQLVGRLAQMYGVDREKLLVTRGSDEGIDLLTRVFCRAGEDAILQSPPAFGMYRIAAQTQGAAVVNVPRDARDFSLDEDGLLQALESGSSIKLVFLTSPSNPTGDLVRPEFLENMLAVTADKALVVVDEAYAEFCNQPSAIEVLERHPHLVILRTLSKAWAAAGLRCGSVIAHADVIGLLRRVIAPYPLPSPVASLALEMLAPENLQNQQKLLRQLQANKSILLEILKGRPFVHAIYPGEANFVLVRVDDADGILAACARKNVILRGFPAEPSLQDCIRISVGSKADLESLRAALDDWEETR